MMRLLWLSLLAASLGAQPARVLIVTGNSDYQYHHWDETSESIREILREAGGFEVRTVEEPRGITAGSLRGYDVVVVNYHGPRWPAAAERAMEEYVRGGGGLVSFHHASYGPFFGMVWGADGKWRQGPDRGWTEWPKMIGARWEADLIGHARRWPFEVEWKTTSHPVSRGLPAKWMANDELYHKLILLPGAEVLAGALSPKEIGGTGNREPLVWVNRYGQGRVFYTVLGHDTMAFYQEGMRQTFARGIGWAAKGDAFTPATAAKPSPVRLLVVTGGHGYPKEFYAMLDSLPDVRWTHAASHAEAFARPLEDRFDVVLLHDMQNVTTPQARDRLKAFVEAGKGVVELHHAIVNYTDWPWWYEEVVGGKYFEKEMPGHPASHYKEDLDFLVKPSKGKDGHPVLAGVGPLWVNDELYKGMWHSDRIEVLMETDHELNDRPVVYVGPYQKARVLYVQLGHSAHTMNHPGFRKLMANAVQWVAPKEK